MTRNATRVALVTLIAGVGAVLAAPRYNVLFIAVDDLRPQLGCYGVQSIHTPNIDALAARGTVFRRAYCQQAVCSPSRTSLLTGLRPDTTKVYDLQTHFRLTIPDAWTLGQQFIKYGYHTQGFGKIYHGGLDDPKSWSVPHWKPSAPTYHDPKILADLARQRAEVKKQGKGPASQVLKRDPKTGIALKKSRPKYRIRGPAWEAPDVPDNALADGMLTDRVIEVMRQVKDKPFFLAAGYVKPHLPFIAPKKYFDLYPPDSIHLPDNMYPPEDCPPIALHNWGELRAYSDTPKKGPLSKEKARELIRAYYAATSFIDAQIGRLLSELDRLGLRDNTVIVLWGDHGWQLGEHGLWCKHTNFELAARAPLIFSAPQQRRRGTVTDALTEFVDIYPTLCDLAGIPIPDGLEGLSAAPLLDKPDLPWKKAAFSQYPRGKVMGYSMRTDRYRYTEWQQRSDGEVVARELYDHETDDAENVNLANRPDKAALVARLSKMLAAGWRAARP